jgi:hypothetical protein
MSTVSGRTKAILLTATVLALLLATIVGMAYLKRLSATGTVKRVNCEVYWDSALTNIVTEMPWGVVEPGKEYNRTVYIKNLSNVQANLTLGTENWNPTVASNYITLYWDYKNQTLAVNQAIKVTFTLAISPSITGIENFSFTVVIICSG